MDKILFNFGNLLRIIDEFPGEKSDGEPLRSLMPGVWPTLGDLRELVASSVKPSMVSPHNESGIITEGGWFTNCPGCEVRLKDNRFIDSAFSGQIVCPVCGRHFEGRG